MSDLMSDFQAPNYSLNAQLETSNLKKCLIKHISDPTVTNIQKHINGKQLHRFLIVKSSFIVCT